MFKAQAYSPNPAVLVQREKQLRDYHVRNWLRSTRTSKELMELCLNHFYSDQPKLLGWSLDMIDGDPKGLVVATIVRETKLNAVQADVVYQRLENTLFLSRKLVDDVLRTNPQDTERALYARVVANAASPGQSFLIVNRPTSISACAILLFMSVALSALFLIGNFEGAMHIKKMMGTAGILSSLVYTFVCGWAYWNMRRWGVLLYSLEPILRFVMGVPHPFIALPLIIVVIGFVNFREMTWK